METEPRKASEVLLELEKKLDAALGIIRAQDLNMKIISNKLNSVMEALQKQNSVPQKITVEAINTVRPPTPLIQQPIQQFDPERQVPISAEEKLPMQAEPSGFRRTSRPETFSGDDSYLNKTAPPPAPKFPVQMPKIPPGRSVSDPPLSKMAEIVVPPSANKQKATAPTPKQQSRVNVVQNAIPVVQRAVNATGKPLFLADVEVIDLATMQIVTKTRTNGIGKWMASLEPGNYRVVIRKVEKVSGERKETLQDIQVDGTQSPYELQTIIIK